MERNKRLAAMADMEASETAKRLRLHFARLNGKFKDMCFAGWKKFYQAAKIGNMAEVTLAKVSSRPCLKLMPPYLQPLFTMPATTLRISSALVT